jgi:hypothetical protein
VLGLTTSSPPVLRSVRTGALLQESDFAVSQSGADHKDQESAATRSRRPKSEIEVSHGLNVMQAVPLKEISSFVLGRYFRMDIVFLFRKASRNLRLSLIASAPISLFAPPQGSKLGKPDQYWQLESPTARKSVLSRDHYRCRGCDRDGLDVTLAVHSINPMASDVQEMLSLCRRCHEIAERRNITADHIPDFLRQVWCQLYPAEREEIQLPLKSDVPDTSTKIQYLEVVAGGHRRSIAHCRAARGVIGPVVRRSMRTRLRSRS